MSQVIHHIPYAQELGDRGAGDLMLPAGACHGCVLVIHGGGWINYAKERMSGIAELLCEHGYASFAINYPLIPSHPWPACGDACLAAGRFIRHGGLDDHAHLSTQPLFVLGASAGGHLALMTGLRLDGVAGIVSIAGIADLPLLAADLGWFARMVPDFFGTDQPTDSAWQDASPCAWVKAGQPPLFLSHDHNDQVVPYPQAARLAAQVEAVGNDVDLYAYDGPGHVMWRNVDAEPPRLLPGIEERLLAFLERTR